MSQCSYHPGAHDTEGKRMTSKLFLCIRTPKCRVMNYFCSSFKNWAVSKKMYFDKRIRLLQRQSFWKTSSSEEFFDSCLQYCTSIYCLSNCGTAFYF
ncbi:unnamed protein product [Cyprideis torosa]|uniref:Uncharacterized protein n=1 Tax=Cyprideis torosa TaxID=163714 RepID=A0A7R8WL40_9CRUS|nr:unnamed protein product [Cyprideis torosa]CAG0903865.1 unnamed protein product [Cyprideis torosa]